MDLRNSTPFAAERFLFTQRGLETLLVVVKATFELGPAEKVAEQQVPVVPADTYAGDPAKTAIAEASDAAPFKPAADVLVRGHAYTQPGKRSEALVGFQLGPLRKTARVVGDRIHERLGASAPAPFEKLPLSWERAFGGTDDSDPARMARFEENPVGRGFRPAHSKRPSSTLLPNIEAPGEPVNAPAARGSPVGFGPIGPSWRPRMGYAGTYDDRWRVEVMPDLPADFDPRFHQCAPPDQILPGISRAARWGR